MIYLIGSLRNPRVPIVANLLRGRGLDVFDDWYASGPEADDCWQQWEQGQGHDYLTALCGRYAQHIFDFDLIHLNRATAGLLVTPAGKSGHLELGWIIGRGHPGYILLDSPPDRWDVMYQLVNGVYTDIETLLTDAVNLR